MAIIPITAGNLIKVSAAITTPFTWVTVGSVLDYAATHDLEGENKVTRFIFGSATGITTTTAGSPVSSYTLNILYDPVDTTGQNALRAAYASGVEVELCVIWGSGPDGYHETVKVKSHLDQAAADGDFMEGTITLEGDGTITAFTAGLPT